MILYHWYGTERFLKDGRWWCTINWSCFVVLPTSPDLRFKSDSGFLKLEIPAPEYRPPPPPLDEMTKAINMTRRQNKPSKSKINVVPPASEPFSQKYTWFKLKISSWHFALLLLVLILPFVPILLAHGEQILGHPKTDNFTAYYFYNHFSRHAWLKGLIPLWNPHIMLGVPFLGEGQASLFHPLSMLFFVLRTSAATNWIIALSCLLTGAFFYGYLRALGLGRAASWCGAVTWSFSNAMISRIYAGHLNILLTFISMPMILMYWERYRTARNIRNLAGISLGYGLMILAYYPQLLYIFSLFLLFYVLLQSGHTVAEAPTLIRQEARYLLMFGISLVMGIALGAVQLLPGLDFVSQSFRQQSTIAFSGNYSFPPENLLTLIAPGFFGDRFTNQTRIYWGRADFWEMWIYIGLLPLMMAMLGAWAAPRRRRLMLLSCAVIFMLIGLGKYTPLFPALYNYLPLFDMFRGPSKYTLITLFCLVTLSAYGFESLFQESDTARRRQMLRVIIVSGGALLLAAFAVMVVLLPEAEKTGSNWQVFMNWIKQTGDSLFDFNGTFMPEFFKKTASKAGHELARGMGIIVLSCTLLWFLRTARWRQYLFPVAAALILVDLLGVYLPMLKTFDRASTDYPLEIDEAAGQFPYRPRIMFPNSPTPNLAMKSGYSSPFGYTGNTLKRYNDLISRIQGQNPTESRSVSTFLKHTPKFSILALDAVAVEHNEIPAGVSPIGRLGDLSLIPYEHYNERLPRTFLAAAPRYFTQSDEALSYVFESQADLQSRPAIERAGKGLAPHPLEPGEDVRFVSFDPNRIELEVQANRPRELVLSSMFEKNWTATVNDTKTEVSPANYAFRAVQVPAGVSRVVFEYRPLAFFWGTGISAVALFLLLLIWVRAGRQTPAPAKALATDLPPLETDQLISPQPAKQISQYWPRGNMVCNA